jgi:hypothetical protein
MLMNNRSAVGALPGDVFQYADRTRRNSYFLSLEAAGASGVPALQVPEKSETLLGDFRPPWLAGFL